MPGAQLGVILDCRNGATASMHAEQVAHITELDV